MPHDDFATEPVRGLTERPAEGEHILWQGRPDWWALSCDALNLPWVAGYFAALAVWRFVAVIDLVPLGEAVVLALPFLALGAVACGLLALFGWVQARATVYTITTRRVALRVGAALVVTLNLPYSRVANVSLETRRRGTGTIAIEALGKMPLGYLTLWPHGRPWHFSRPQPALRCIADAERVAGILAEAAEAHLSQPSLAKTGPGPARPAVAAE